MNYFLTVTFPDWIRENIVFKFKDEYSHGPTPLAKLLLWIFVSVIVLAGVSEIYLYLNNFNKEVVVEVYSRSETFVLDAAEEACGIRPQPDWSRRNMIHTKRFGWQGMAQDGNAFIFVQQQWLNIPIEGDWEPVKMYAGESDVIMDANIPAGEIYDAVYERALKEVSRLNYIVVLAPIPDETLLHTPVTVHCVRHATIDWTFWN